MPKGIYIRTEKSKRNCRMNLEKARNSYNPRNLGKKASEETKKRMSKARKGLLLESHLSEEAKKKMSIAHKGKPLINAGSFTKGFTPWNKGKKGYPISWRGRASEETKRKISIAGLGRKHTLEARIKIGEAHKRERNVNWRGGITPINHKIRTSFEYTLWRESVFQRDNYTCIWCGARSRKGQGVILHADHIKPFAYFPELRFDINNGRTLCIDCHKTTETYSKKANAYAQQ